jgi:hypothetical protein
MADAAKDELYRKTAELLLKAQTQATEDALTASKLATVNWNEYNNGSLIIKEEDLAGEIFGKMVVTHELYCSEWNRHRDVKEAYGRLLRKFEQPSADISKAYHEFETVFTAGRQTHETCQAELLRTLVSELIILKKL